MNKDADTEPIKVLQNFNVIKKIGQGGFSQIYLAEDKTTHKKFVLKAIKNPNNKKRLQRELSLLKSVQEHDNILTYHGFFKDKGRYFLQFDYIEHGDLRKLLKKQGSFTQEELCCILLQMCEVLIYLKSKSIVHKDIKESNILKKEDGHYVLCDFGVSEQKESIETLHIKSDDDIVAPEVFKGEYSFPSDMYSLGCTLFYLCTKEYIYGIDDDSSYAYKMFAHSCLDPDISLVNSDLMKYLIVKMTHKDPLQRITPEKLKEVLTQNQKIEEVTVNQTQYEEYKKRSAVELYEILADKNILFAINNLAIQYDEELEECEKAFALYKKAATNGLIKSMHNIALCYLNAEGVEQDYSKAFAWFKKAALKNHEKSMYYLGLFYENGWYVQPDQKKAIAMYIESANNGYKKAYNRLHDIKSVNR